MFDSHSAMHRRLFLGLLGSFALVLGDRASAQATWIVDETGGAGSHFRDLKSAVQRANAGDVVVVRRGAYATTTIEKGIAILGEAGATIDTAGFPEQPLRVVGLTAAEVCRIDGLTVRGRTGLSVVSLADNDGVVALSNLKIGYAASAGEHGLAIERSRAVTVQGCDVDMGMRIDNSRVSVVHSIFIRRFASFPINGSLSAIQATASDVEFTGVTATGQNGSFPYLGGTPALAAAGCRIRVAGDGTSVFTAGVDQNVAVAALSASKASSLELDPLVQLRSSGGATGHAGFSSVRTRRLPTLVASGGTVGGQVTVEVRTPAGDSYAVGVGLPAAPVTVQPLGDVWIAPGSLTVLAIGVQGVSGRWQASYPIPPIGQLRGLPLSWQALTAASSGFEMTPPSMVTLR